MNKTILATAIAATMTVASSASADIIDIAWTGLFTMVSPGGGGVVTNGTSPDAADVFGIHTNASGTMSFDTDTFTGSAELNPFIFSGNTATLTPGTTQMIAIGDGLGGPGTMVVAYMDFNWGPNTNIPVTLVGDAAGFFGAGPYSVGQVITGGSPSSTINDLGAFGNPTFDPNYNLLAGGIPFAMTTLDDLDFNPATNVTDDGITGTPMATAPFPDHNAAFDITEMTITNITPSVIPVPAAVWLFGSGLLGLVGVARRRKA